ncbi:unnamed protein product, partial [Discosporangium mesarthrocarpum]
AYASEIVEFEDIIRGGTKPLVTCHDSCRTAIIAEAASQSANSGTPVTISYGSL